MSKSKKLIEVSLPLDVINRASVKELQNPFIRGHPKGLKWWARLPLAACRAVVWATYVDDPSTRPDVFPTPELQAQERERLFSLLAAALADTVPSDAALGALRAELPEQDNLPPVIDPFAGGGTIPLEAIRLGLRSYASDLNPVAVLIDRVLLELPSRFCGRTPVHPELSSEWIGLRSWDSAEGLAEDVRQYGKVLQAEAQRRLGDAFPSVRLGQDDGGGTSDVIAWLWARAVQCPNPACQVLTPLMKSFNLSTKKARPRHIAPFVDNQAQMVLFKVKSGLSKETAGTVARSGFRCLACGTTHPLDYVRREGHQGRLSTIPVAVVADGLRSRVYVDFPSDLGEDAKAVLPSWTPDQEFPDNPRYISPPLYGMRRFADVFTPRQLVALGTFTELIRSTVDRVRADALDKGWGDDGLRLHEGGKLATAYGDAVGLLLGEALGRAVMFHSTLCKWNVTNENVTNPFSLQTLSMSWDFAEANPLIGSLSFVAHADLVADILEGLPAIDSDEPPRATQLNASEVMPYEKGVVITDPPYYDNVGYSDLSDFFYVWIREALRVIDPDLFSTLLTPKAQELVADPTRNEGDSDAAASSFRIGLESTFSRIREVQSNSYPVSVFYAFKQAEERGSGPGMVSTGWEAMLDGLIGGGLMILRTWPLQTVRPARARGQLSNALSSSILLVCRPRPESAQMATRSEFVSALRSELPAEIRSLQELSIAPVDLAQSAIGPGMAVYSRYSKVVESDGTPMTVRAALQLINEALQEVLTQEETEFDPDTRWALTWFEQHGMSTGPFGDAETLSKAKDTAVEGVVSAGIATTASGKVQLVARRDLPPDWDPLSDKRATVWELTQQLIRRLDSSELEAAELLKRVGGGLGTRARQLAYLLFRISERRGWTEEALAYNGLIVAWPEISRLRSSDMAPMQQSFTE